MYKKIICFCLILAMGLALLGCGARTAGSEAAGSETGGAASETNAGATTETATEATTEITTEATTEAETLGELTGDFELGKFVKVKSSEWTLDGMKLFSADRSEIENINPIDTFAPGETIIFYINSNYREISGKPTIVVVPHSENPEAMPDPDSYVLEFSSEGHETLNDGKICGAIDEIGYYDVVLIYGESVRAYMVIAIDNLE